MRTQPSITCPWCGAKSYNPNDIKNLYCGRCHWWTSDPQLGQVRPDEIGPQPLVIDAPRGSAAHRAFKNLAIRLETRRAIRAGEHVHVVGLDRDECYGADPPCKPRPRPRGPVIRQGFYDEIKEWPDATTD